MKIDLHLHSKNSDGADTIEELIPKVVEAGVDVFALTDHDRADGWAKARELATELNLSFIPGMEITTEGRFTEKPFGIHLLAYLPNPELPELRQILEVNQSARHVRIQKFINNLQADYPELTYEYVLSLVLPGATLGRPALATALSSLGVAATPGEVFNMGILGKSGPYYVRNEAPDVLGVIKAVRDAGGVPVIAHPLARKKKEMPEEFVFPREDFIKMVEAGLLGLETNHSEVPPHVKTILDDFAREFDLVTTGSSDYHGLTVKANNPIGLRLTEPAQLNRVLELGTGAEPLINHEL